MKLSKQERIGLLIILAVIILALGAFLIVKPAFEQIGVTKEQLAVKEKELQNLEEKQARKAPLKQSILAAYEEGAHLADMFFPELTSYESDDAFREFIQQCKSNIVVQQITVGAPTTTTLSATFFSSESVTYALKSYATQGVERTEEEAALAARQLAIRSALSGSQTIGASTVEFTVYALSYDDLLQFADEVNDYIKEENGTSTRKAISIDGLSLSYSTVPRVYNSLIEADGNNMGILGTDALNDLSGANLPYPDGASSGTSTTPVTPSEGDEDGDNTEAVLPGLDSDEDPTPSTYIVQQSFTLTFYSLERMQDPTAQLNAQDGIVNE